MATRTQLARCLACLMILGCGQAERTPEGPAELTTGSWPDTPPPPEAFLETDDDPFDPRLALMFPELLATRERVCDVTEIGELQQVTEADPLAEPLPPDPEAEAPARDEPSHHQRLRCRTPTGEGWVELTYTKESAPLAAFVDAGQRIRIRFEGKASAEGPPLAAFVASIGDAPPYPPRRWLHANVRAGDDPATARGEFRCAVTDAGPITPIPPAVEEDRPDPSHVQLVTCRHTLGTRLVQLRYPAAQALASLRVRRGEVVTLQAVSADGPIPIARYAGP